MARRASRRITLLGLDPGLSYTGYAIARANPETGRIHQVIEVGAFTTCRNNLRSVRKTSDDFRRATEQCCNIHRLLDRFSVDVIAAEMATTTPYPKPTFSFGVMIGVLASLNRPVIEVLPYEVKSAATGNQRATKRDIIEWAIRVPSGPDVKWPTSSRRNKLDLSFGGQFITKAAEHPADALAAIQAAMFTEQFRLAKTLFCR